METQCEEIDAAPETSVWSDSFNDDKLEPSALQTVNSKGTVPLQTWALLLQVFRRGFSML